MSGRILSFAMALALFLAHSARAGKVQAEHDAKADLASFHTDRWKVDLGPAPQDLDGPTRSPDRADDGAERPARPASSCGRRIGERP